jgi:ACS family tartrate transporter-like MFS transporter
MGLAGWKWMYIAEAVPTVLVGFVILLCITDRPSQAQWLSGDERSWLITLLETERHLVEKKRKIGLWQSFFDPKVLILTLNYFGIVGASVGMLLFVPQMVKTLGLTNMQVGWVTMIPYLCGTVGMVVWGWYSDRTGERRWNLFAACVTSTVGLIIAGQTIGTAWAIVGMAIAAVGFYGSKGPFWSMPSMMLTGTAAAAGIAWINAAGNLGGFFGPTIVGWAKNYTGNFSSGLYALACFSLVSAIVTAFWLHIPNPARRDAVSVPAE